MNLNRFKNVLITLLVFLALYQTSEIWFEDTGGSFFTLFGRSRQVSVESGLMRNFAFPMRIVVGNGSEDFHVVYSGMSDNDVRAFADEVLLAALSGGGAARVTSPDFEELLKGSVVIYEYAKEMSSMHFVKALGLGMAAQPAIEIFNRILFFADDSGLNVYFHNRYTKSWAGYLVNEPTALEEFFAVTNSAANLSASDNIRWSSSFLLGLDSDPYNNLFIPVWGDGYYYPVGEARPAHFDIADGAVKSTIRANLMSFFDNPSAVYDASIAPIFAWADENNIVRHFPENVIQYISYRRDGTNTELLDDFAAALDFMAKRDLFLTNDIYLSGFEERNNERIFYFDYILEGLPIVFADSLRNSIGELTTNGIAVRFRDGNLVSYTRLAYEFSVNDGIRERANRDLPLYIINSELDPNSLESITLAFVAPGIDRLTGVGTMNLWVDFRMWDGMSSMESLNTNPY